MDLTISDSTPFSVTEVAFEAPPSKLVPVMVTRVPSCPELGDTAVTFPIGDGVENGVDVVGECVGESVGEIVGEPDGESVGETVGGTVGEIVGDCEGVDVVGECVGESVGDMVGESETVGEVEGDRVGNRVGADEVGATVTHTPSPLHDFFDRLSSVAMLFEHERDTTTNSVISSVP